ncbi:MAG: hypothetical protein JWQ81_2198 [Amycolatopsis sp.]|uniref:hypothetical protein n=1 Tax=Amycolatopsis sp. TaxID=37632 RepID=UPI002622BE77|nr:hypothetical protein [Amycolatopsis sp.]MCU1681459.1 hypothetical protein [Amycolatopsis sp.]
MNATLRRLLLTGLALAGAYTGFWAYFAPQPWYEHFPGFGRSWLPPLGPYNEHLAKDAGAMFLALTVLSLIALRYVHNDVLVRTAGFGWLTFNVLHMTYHFQHLDMYDTVDKLLNVVTLGLLAAGSIALILATVVRRTSATPGKAPAEH